VGEKDGENGMTWAEQLARIRRFLRDPNGLIWSDALLLRLYNAEQDDLYTQLGLIEGAWAACLPPRFEASYTHDWEWAFAPHSDGEVYLWSRYSDLYGYAVTHRWEPETLAGTSGTSDVGDHYTHPWEAYTSITPGVVPPSLIPENFDNIEWISWDKRVLEPTHLADPQRMDPSWMTRTGIPFQYWRDEKISSRVYLYPIIDSLTWYDCTTDYSLAWPTGSYVDGLDSSETAEDSVSLAITETGNDGHLEYHWNDEASAWSGTTIYAGVSPTV
jgi:hypothetical protein